MRPGEYFANLVLGQSLSSEEIAQIKTEDDTAWISVNGSNIQIERSVYTHTGVIVVPRVENANEITEYLIDNVATDYTNHGYIYSGQAPDGYPFTQMGTTGNIYNGYTSGSTNNLYNELIPNGGGTATAAYIYNGIGAGYTGNFYNGYNGNGVIHNQYNNNFNGVDYSAYLYNGYLDSTGYFYNGYNDGSSGIIYNGNNSNVGAIIENGKLASTGYFYNGYNTGSSGTVRNGWGGKGYFYNGGTGVGLTTANATAYLYNGYNGSGSFMNGTSGLPGGSAGVGGGTGYLYNGNQYSIGYIYNKGTIYNGGDLYNLSGGNGVGYIYNGTEGRAYLYNASTGTIFNGRNGTLDNGWFGTLINDGVLDNRYGVFVNSNPLATLAGSGTFKGSIESPQFISGIIAPGGTLDAVNGNPNPTSYRDTDGTFTFEGNLTLLPPAQGYAGRLKLSLTNATSYDVLKVTGDAYFPNSTIELVGFDSFKQATFNDGLTKLILIDGDSDGDNTGTLSFGSSTFLIGLGLDPSTGQYWSLADLVNTGDVFTSSSVLDFSIGVESNDLVLSILKSLPPTDLALNTDIIYNNFPADVTFATLSSTDPDPGETFTYSLVAGTGDTDNGNFTISGNGLKINASPDYNTKNSYSIRVRTTDRGGFYYEKALTISVNSVDASPTDLTLSSAHVQEIAPANTVIGTLSTTDPQVGDTFTYSLVSGTGDTDNSTFTITGDQLTINSSPDYETKNAYSIRVRTTDALGLFYEEALTISVDDVVDTTDQTNFLINTYTASSQMLATVASLQDGGFVVTWSSSGQDGSGYGIYGQRYASDGTAVGGEFQANTYTASSQWFSSVTGLQGGGFVVTWSSSGQDGSNNGVYGQRYGSDGTAVGSEFLVNTDTAGSQSLPSVTGLQDGGFVVTWLSFGSGSYGQRYGSDGTAVGSQFLITTGNLASATVASLQDGGFVVAWNNTSIYGQRYGSDGTAVGSAFPVSLPRLAVEIAVTGLQDGGFVVVWESDKDGSGSDYDVYGQRYGSDGTAVGSEFQVNTYTRARQVDPSVTGLPDGGFVVVWSSDGQDGSGYGVYVQQFNAQGEKVGSEILMNAIADGSQYVEYTSGNALTTLSNGNVVVVWDGNGTGDGDGVYGSILIPHAAPTDLAISANSVDENVATNTVIGMLSSTDPNVGDTFTYSLVAGTGDTDNATFTMDGDQLLISTSPNFEAQNSYSVRVRTTDQVGLSYEEALVITVTNVNEAPTAVTLTNQETAIAENTSTATRIKVADIAITDDGLGTNNLSVSGTDASFFEVDATGLYLKEGTAIDYETKSSYAVTVEVDDSTVGSTPDATANYNLTLLDRAVFAIDDATVGEAAGTASFTVTTTDPIATGTATVNYATANGTAFASPYDYTATSGTLTFTGGGATTQTINVDITDDTYYEAVDETFTVNLSNPTDGTIADAQGIGTIQDNDTPVTVSVLDASIPEGNSGTTNLAFLIALSAPSGQVVTVDYATANDTATAGDDYTTTSGTIVIQAGATSGVVIVPVLGDNTDTTDETFFLNIANATGGVTIADAQGTGTIINDDGLSGGLTLTGTAGNDILTGSTTDDTLTGLAGADNLDGQGGADTFVYNALTDSLLGGRDSIRTFKPSEGDRIDLATVPTSVFYVGSVASSISATALTAAYAAADSNTGLAANEAVFFATGSGRTQRLYLSINDGTAAFDQNSDLVMEVTGMSGAPSVVGALTVGNYFV